MTEERKPPQRLRVSHRECGPSRKKLGGTKLVYFHGIAKERIGQVHKVIPVLKVGTKEVEEISFVGKQPCTMLIASVYAPILIKKIVFGEVQYAP